MKGTHHLVIGMGTGVAAAAILSPESIPVGIGIIGATALGSLFPDIDNVKSKISKRLKILSRIVNKAFGHRGFIHSPLCMIIIYCTVSYLWKGVPYPCGFLLGYAGHLFADMMTKGGVPLLYPFKKKFRLTFLKSGSKVEGFVAFLVLLIIVAGLIMLNYYGIFGKI